MVWNGSQNVSFHLNGVKILVPFTERRLSFKWCEDTGDVHKASPFKWCEDTSTVHRTSRFILILWSHWYHSRNGAFHLYGLKILVPYTERRVSFRWCEHILVPYTEHPVSLKWCEDNCIVHRASRSCVPVHRCMSVLSRLTSCTHRESYCFIEMLPNIRSCQHTD